MYTVLALGQMLVDIEGKIEGSPRRSRLLVCLCYVNVLVPRCCTANRLQACMR